MVNIRRGLDYKDVLLVPQSSGVRHRADVSLKTVISRNARKHSANPNSPVEISINIPIISANMSTITWAHMSQAMNRIGALGILHRYKSFEEICDVITFIKFDSKNYLAIPSIGVDNNALNNALGYLNLGANAICIDVAHAHSLHTLDLIRHLKEIRPETHIIAGNIATAKAAEDLINCGATSIKVGIGNGSVCTTRDKTGYGVPQLTAIIDVVEVARKHNIPVIADGGISSSADIVKALAAGASAIMSGHLFAGCPESAGWGSEDRAANYSGMASEHSQKAFKGTSSYIEGKSTLVEPKPPVEEIMRSLIEGIKSGFSYCGAHDIKQLWNNAEFITQGV